VDALALVRFDADEAGSRRALDRLQVVQHLDLIGHAVLHVDQDPVESL
jgi:hypothetical protein